MNEAQVQGRARSSSDPFDRIVALLKDVKPTPRGVRAKCPAHDDTTPSLDVHRGDDGTVLLQCRSHRCSHESIVAALGLLPRDLFPPTSGFRRAACNKQRRPLKRHSTMEKAVKAAAWSAAGGQGGGRVTSHVYETAEGEAAVVVVRVDFDDGRQKQFRRVSRDGDAWLCKDMPAPKPLYRLPSLTTANGDERVLVAEGEKCADRLAGLGYLATTSEGGANADLGDTDWSVLAGRVVCILPDNDDPGRIYAMHVAAEAHRAGARTVHLVGLEGLTEGHDVFDWIVAREAEGRAPDQVVAELNQLLAAAPVITAEQAADTEVGELSSGAVGELLIPLGDCDPVTGRVVLSPRRTLPTAEAFISKFFSHENGRTLQFYAGSLWAWRGNRYVELEDAEVEQLLHHWLHACLRYVMNRETRTPELVDFESNPGSVKAALDTIKKKVFLAASTKVPAWLPGEREQVAPHDLLACRSASLHIPTGTLLAPTPTLFNHNALEFDYDALASEPVRWSAFLRDIFGDDDASIGLLQDWFGYCLTANTALQKILLLVGPKRSGKGTIARVLRKLIGDMNCVGPTVSGLAGNFGLQTLLGKSLAIVSDARFHGDHVSTVVERLLCISGEDPITVDRKFKESVTLQLPVRFMFLTNELPRVNDASTALAGRFLVLSLTKSFYGRENVDLTEQLLGELPGILLWALDGWKRLHKRRRFVESESARTAMQDMEDLSSPVTAFVRERCIVGPNQRVQCDAIYREWVSWCTEDGRTTPPTKQTFGRDLQAAVPGLRRRRGTGMTGFYEGIGLQSGEKP